MSYKVTKSHHEWRVLSEVERWGTLLLFLLLSLCLPSGANAKELTAQVIDQYGQPIEAVSVITNVEGFGTKTDSSGWFKLEIPESVNRVTFSSVGFYPRQFKSEQLPLVVALETRYYQWDKIVITAERARPGLSPIAFDNFSGDEIARDFTVGDPSLLLNTTPNFYSFTDNGTNLGYSYTQIRGFDDKRIATYINGVPLNDPEDQYNYWVDLPDFVSNVTDIQVQRGVGNSLYGDASFGGTVNVVTSAFGLPRVASFTSGFGQHLQDGKAIGNTYKQSIQYSSGLIDGRWAFSGRFSKTKTDGYRQDSWVDSWSYYLSLARLDPNMSTELYIFGGPMKLHLTFWGVDRATLKTDRRFNPLSYQNETDNFNQPHYHLHNSWKINDKTTLFNTLYFIRGEGFFEQRYIDTLYADFNIDTSASGGNQRGDLVVRQEVAKFQLGLNPRLEIKHSRGTHSAGGSIYFFESNHWGKVVKGNNLSMLTASDIKYYQYYGKKIVASFYGEEYYHLNDKLSLQATAQLRYQDYSFEQDRIGLFRGFDYRLNWLFFSPRLGFNFQLINEAKRRLNLYTNIALASRTPTDAAIYDASNRYVLPSIEMTTSVSNSGDTVYNFGKPLFESEQVFDIELGGNYHAKKYSAGLNFYWMNFSDEIIPYGGINPSNGQLTTVNANGSYRTGVEIQGSYQTSDDFKIDANFSFNRYRIKDFTGTLPVYDTSFTYLGDTTIAFENVTGLAFPELLGNFIVDYLHDPLRLTYRFRLVGQQQLELANLDSLAIGAFTESALSASYTFRNFLTMGDLTLTGVVNNLFDKKHEVSGYGWNYGTASGAGAPITITGGAEYYVGSERSWFGQLKLTLF